MNEVPNEPTDSAVEAQTANVQSLPMIEILGSDDSILGTVTRMVVGQVNRSGENYAAHGSTP